MNKKAKQPKTFLGTAAKITIILVIIGTVTASMEAAMFRRVIFAFHIPLFFFIHGFTLRPGTDNTARAWTRFVRQMVLAFIIPYVLWALIYSTFSYQNLGWIFYGSRQSLERAQTLPTLWFLTCMFTAQLLVECVMALLPRVKLGQRLAAFLASVVSFAVGFLLPPIEGLGYPLCLNIAFVATGFLLLGYASFDLLTKLKEKPLRPALMLLVSAAVFVGAIVAQGERFAFASMAAGEYGNIFWFMVCALSGTLAVLALSMLLTRCWKQEGPLVPPAVPRLYVSRNTLGTFVIQQPLLQQVLLPLLMQLGGGKLPKVVVILLAVVLAFVIARLIIKVFDRYIPQLFGLYPSKELLIVEDPALPPQRVDAGK